MMSVMLYEWCYTKKEIIPIHIDIDEVPANQVACS